VTKRNWQGQNDMGAPSQIVNSRAATKNHSVS
jgi:hypothetical protein